LTSWLTYPNSSQKRNQSDNMGFGADKAPGLDGFLILFYRRFWDIMKLEIITRWKVFTMVPSNLTNSIMRIG